MTSELSAVVEASRERLTSADLDSPTAVIGAAARWAAGNGWVQLAAVACVAVLVSALRWERGQQRALAADEAASGTEWFWGDVPDQSPPVPTVAHPVPSFHAPQGGADRPSEAALPRGRAGTATPPREIVI